MLSPGPLPQAPYITIHFSLNGTSLSLFVGFEVGSRHKGPETTNISRVGLRPPSGTPGGRGQDRRTHPEGALGHIDASPGDDDGVFNRLGGHIGAAEGAVAIGDDHDVDRAAIGILWASGNKSLRALRPPQSTGAPCSEGALRQPSGLESPAPRALVVKAGPGGPEI